MNRRNMAPKCVNARPMKRGINRRGVLKGAGTTALASASVMVGSGKFAMAAEGGKNINTNHAVYLYPSGDIVDVVLRSAVDYHIKGAGFDVNGPTTKIVCDQFIHAGSDSMWLRQSSGNCA